MTLPNQHSATQIQQDWQQATEQATEAGRPPLLELGMDRQLINNLPVLLTLAAWTLNRTDITQPLLLTGDVDALWPVPLLYTTALPMRPHASGAAPSLQLVYGGADRATYLASLTTHATQRLHSGALYAVDLPVAMQPLLSTHTQPHANASWPALPLTLLHTATANRSIEPNPTAAPALDDPWLAWAALVMIVTLVLLAMFM